MQDQAQSLFAEQHITSPKAAAPLRSRRKQPESPAEEQAKVSISPKSSSHRPQRTASFVAQSKIEQQPQTSSEEDDDESGSSNKQVALVNKPSSQAEVLNGDGRSKRKRSLRGEHIPTPSPPKRHTRRNNACVTDTLVKQEDPVSPPSDKTHGDTQQNQQHTQDEEQTQAQLSNLTSLQHQELRQPHEQQQTTLFGEQEQVLLLRQERLRLQRELEQAREEVKKELQFLLNLRQEVTREKEHQQRLQQQGQPIIANNFEDETVDIDGEDEQPAMVVNMTTAVVQHPMEVDRVDAQTQTDDTSPPSRTPRKKQQPSSSGNTSSSETPDKKAKKQNKSNDTENNNNRTKKSSKSNKANHKTGEKIGEKTGEVKHVQLFNFLSRMHDGCVRRVRMRCLSQLKA
jgi:hypothetical protein